MPSNMTLLNTFFPVISSPTILLLAIPLLDALFPDFSPRALIFLDVLALEQARYTEKDF